MPLLSVEQIALSPVDALLASCLVNDGDIVFWDLSKNEPIWKRIKGTNATRLAFSPDGKVLASLSQDGHIVTLWDVSSRRKLGDLGRRKAADDSTEWGWGEGIAFSADGRRLASAARGKLVVWDIAKSWLRRACNIANPNITCEEWHEWRGDQAYTKACVEHPGPKLCSDTENQENHYSATAW